MMKFFRKYNKQLLAVFMTLLMIVFMGGAALEGMFNPSGNRVVARSRLGDITEYDQQLVARATRPMEIMGIDWRRLFGGAGKALQEVDWILLVREAEEFGTRAGESSARNWFQTDTQLDDISRRMSIKPARVLQAVADYRSILQTAFAVADSAAPSAAAVAAAARDALEAVRINAVVLPAEAFSDPTYEPGNAEIEAQFEAYRSQEAGTGLNFGYYQQPAVQVQFIEIDRDAIATQITLANLDRRAKSYFERERTTNLKFRRPADEIRLPPGVEGPPQDPYLSWEEAGEIAKEGVRIEQRRSISVDVLLHKGFVEAAHDISRHDVLVESDLQMAKRWMPPSEASLPTDIRDAVGRVSSKHIKAGEPIRHNAINRRTLVRRGDPIIVRCLVGGTVISIQAEARGVGSEGDII
ncbi:MAG: flagellar basal body P-ring formation protein FlgA [Planctomycetes bacterium]|nr:flagellar basal body P-ring formation protein FlgA [Planctomycetota bacterium]